MFLHGKNVIYVGGFGGIGYASCKKLLKEHVLNLVIFEQHENVQKLAELQQESENSKITFIQVDVTNRRSLEAAYNMAVLQLDHRLDCVINGSGVYNDQNPELTVQVNLLGVINSTLVAIEHMDRSKIGPGGLIVNISSITALKPNPFMAIYSATKCGILGFTQALADDFYNARTGIDFLTICPGGTTTDLIMDPVDKSTFMFASAEHRQKNNNSLKQSAEECAECLIKAMEIGRNGSVWVCDLGKLEEIKMPLLWQRQTSTADNSQN